MESPLFQTFGMTHDSIAWSWESELELKIWESAQLYSSLLTRPDMTAAAAVTAMRRRFVPDLEEGIALGLFFKRGYFAKDVINSWWRQQDKKLSKN